MEGLSDTMPMPPLPPPGGSPTDTGGYVDPIVSTAGGGDVAEGGGGSGGGYPHIGHHAVVAPYDHPHIGQPHYSYVGYSYLDPNAAAAAAAAIAAASGSSMYDQAPYGLYAGTLPQFSVPSIPSTTQPDNVQSFPPLEEPMPPLEEHQKSDSQVEVQPEVQESEPEPEPEPESESEVEGKVSAVKAKPSRSKSKSQPPSQSNASITRMFDLCKSQKWNEVESIIGRNPSLAGSSMTMANNITTTVMHQAITSKGAVGPRASLVRSILSVQPSAAAIKNGYGSLPLHVLAQRNCKMKSKIKEELIRKLIEAFPAGLCSEGGVGKRTPLHIAFTDYISPSLAKFMIDSGPAASKMKDKKGWLPIHVACSRHASPEKLKILLAANPASLHDRTDKGETIYDLAKSTATKSHPNRSLIKTLESLLGIPSKTGSRSGTAKKVASSRKVAAAPKRPSGASKRQVKSCDNVILKSNGEIQIQPHGSAASNHSALPLPLGLPMPSPSKQISPVRHRGKRSNRSRSSSSSTTSSANEGTPKKKVRNTEVLESTSSDGDAAALLLQLGGASAEV